MRSTKLLLVMMWSVLGAGCDRDESDCADGFGCVTTTADATSAGDEGGSDSSDEGAGESSTQADTGALCPADANHCLDANSIELCDPEDGKVYQFTCEYFCGQGVASLGCQQASEGDSCFCGDPVEPCSAGDTQECATDNSLRACEGGEWRVGDCDTVCVDAGFVGAYSEAACELGDKGLDVCMCSTDSCTPNAGRCTGSNSMAFCTGISWQEFSCDELCADAELGVGIGCHYSADIGAESCLCA